MRRDHDPRSRDGAVLAQERIDIRAADTALLPAGCAGVSARRTSRAHTSA